MSENELPRITVAEMLGTDPASCETFEAFLDRFEAENRPYRIVDEVAGIDLVLMPYALYSAWKTALGQPVGDMPEITHERFAEIFRASRGAVDPDLGLGL